MVSVEVVFSPAISGESFLRAVAHRSGRCTRCRRRRSSLLRCRRRPASSPSRSDSQHPQVTPSAASCMANMSVSISMARDIGHRRIKGAEDCGFFSFLLFAGLLCWNDANKPVQCVRYHVAEGVVYNYKERQQCHNFNRRVCLGDGFCGWGNVVNDRECCKRAIAWR